MDLRRDGGGSLDEAVNLTGLFIKKGPVVQAKDGKGDIRVSKDRDSAVAYDGPMIVLGNRLSASASEIFAAALQDYNRAVVVGDQNTFGKGTVQTMLEMGRAMPFLGGGGNAAGALKLTIQKFYRIAGGSTQLRGVESDIKLPSPYDHPEIGESALKGPLPYDTVDPVPFDRLERSLFKNELRQRSATRIAVDPEFRYITEDLDRLKQRIAENTVSLNEKVRRAEIDEDKQRKETRTANRAKIKASDRKTYAITLDNVDKPELQLAVNDKKTSGNGGETIGDVVSPKTPSPKVVTPDSEPVAATTPLDEDADDDEEDPGTKKSGIDPIKTETLNILADLVELSRPAKATTASTAAGK
jgi:carboxyl-terminal processing protease